MSIINCFSANTGLDINGIIEYYYVYAGENILAGNFVELVEGTQNQIRKATTSRFIGIAKTKGTGGSQIKVYVPDI